jgi:CRP-like cAMP-binding protein
VELFNRLTPAEVANVAERMRRRRYAPGDIVMRQGEPAEEFFLIRSGTASVMAAKPGEPESHIALLGTGEVLGEMALVSGEPRNATVRAVDELDTFYLSRTDFQEALQFSAAFKDQIRRTYFDRLEPVLRATRS